MANILSAYYHTSAESSDSASNETLVILRPKAPQQDFWLTLFDLNSPEVPLLVNGATYATVARDSGIIQLPNGARSVTYGKLTVADADEVEVDWQNRKISVRGGTYGHDKLSEVPDGEIIQLKLD